MIASIDEQLDMEIFLDRIELEKMQFEEVKGVLVRISNPKQQGLIVASINDSRGFENGFGIGLCDKKYFGILEGFEMEIFIQKNWYEHILKNGRLELRHSLRSGSKIAIYDLSNPHRDDSTHISLTTESLEFYRDNKELIRKW